MRVKSGRIGMILCAGVMAFTALAGCGKTPSATVDSNYEWTYKKERVADSSEIPSWTQKEMSLVAWNANGTGGFTKYRSNEDVVSPEIKRVTGVSVNQSKSFDNAGSSIDAALQKIVLAGNYPDVAYGTHETAEIIKAGDYSLVYDLTELIDEYCPTIKARMPEYVWNTPAVNGGRDGKIYGLPFNLGDVGLSTVDPDADPRKSLAFEYMQDYYGCVYVREDILKEAYPQAKTYQEIKDIYAEKGGFTVDDLYDVKITSAEEFYGFLENLNKTILSNPKYTFSNGRRVMPILACDGSDRDNWSLMSGLWPKLMGASGYLNSMFSYWDAKDHKVKNMMLQDFFKEYLKKWNEMIRAGSLMNDYGFRTPYSTIQAELNSGYYAVTYPNAVPAGYQATLEDGSTVKYRKVYLQIELGENFEFFAQSAPVPSSLVIFKKSVAESDLPQLLRWMDYQCSTIADKLYAWGPASAGLFTEENGERKFKDEELVNQMVYSTGSIGQKVERYNLSNGTLASPQPTFPFFYVGASKEHPKCVYDLSVMSDMVDVSFSPAAIDSHNNDKLVNIARRADIYTWSESDLPGVTTVWAKRGTIEKTISSVLLATSSSDFENKYNAMVRGATTAGWTDAYFGGDYTDAFLRLNADFLQNFKKGIS